MKKRIAPCVLALHLLLTACGGSAGPNFDDPQPMPGFDAQNQYLQVGGAGAFQETDGFFCGHSRSDDFLRYYDKVSGISGVLCRDPACSHDTRECGAYVGRAGAGLSWYGGALYWIADGGGEDRDDYLLRDDLSGAGREKVKRISEEDIVFEYQPQWYTIHRGKLYFLGVDSLLTGSSVSQRISLVCAPLDEFEEFTVLYDRIFDCGVHPTVRFAGNSVYLSIVSWRRDGDEVSERTITITKYDAVTGEPEVVYEETGMQRSVGGLWVTEQGEIYLSFEGDDYGGSVWKIEEGKRTEIISWEGDDSRIYPLKDIAVKLTAEYREDGSRIRYVDIRSYTGELLYSGELFPNGVPGIEENPSDLTIGVVGGDAEKIILDLGDFLDGEDISYTVMVDLSTMKPTILWSE